MKKLLNLTLLIAVGAIPVAVLGADWPIWGRDGSRNMVSEEKGLSTDFTPGRYRGNSEDIDMATTKNVRWVAKLGSQSYGNPTVAGGRVFVGTNNDTPRDPKYKGDYSCVMCFDEKSGDFLWQLAIPKLGTGKVSDWEYLGICSSPTVEGNRVYLVSNRCEVLCLDINGMGDGNAGPFMDEAKYTAVQNTPPVAIGPKDGDIIWRFDMRELGVFPHNITSCSVLLVGDRVVATTSNGVDWTHTTIPNPRAPTMVMLNKNTGALLGEEASGISARTLHSNWSSPAYGKVNGEDTIIFGGGDGICYGFDMQNTVKDGDLNLLKELWRYDCNPAHYRMKDGKPIKYATPNGPSEVIATPVFYKNRVYVPVGQDPEHGEGMGNLSCIDITKRSDITKSATVWSSQKVARSLSTPSIADGLVYVADFSGFIHCFDAETGQQYWKYDTKSHIWGSTLVVDGKVYSGTEDGDLVILAAGKIMKEIKKVDFRAPIYSSPVVANGTLYVETPTHLFAIAPVAR